MQRVLNRLTHPATDGLGTSRMVFQQKNKTKVGPEVLLLLEVMNEEFDVRLEMPSFMDEHLERPLTPSTERVSFLENAMKELGGDYIPPSPPKVVCELDLAFGEKKFSTGNVMLATFYQLTFRLEGKTRIPVEGAYDGQEIGRDPEASGVWLSSTRGRQRTAAPARLNDDDCSRKAG